MKLQNVLNSYQALLRLGQTPLAAPAAFKVARCIKAVKQAAECYDETQLKKLKEYKLDGRVDASGVLQFKKDDTEESQAFYSDNYKNMLAEMVALRRTQEVEMKDAPRLSLSELRNAEGDEIDVPPVVLSELLWLFLPDDDDENNDN